ncbi:unnamed protein product [Closterium sp. NIES-65]|nr:unnamed protein product [Closterium sp. NIES-65]
MAVDNGNAHSMGRPVKALVRVATQVNVVQAHRLVNFDAPAACVTLDPSAQASLNEGSQGVEVWWLGAPRQSNGLNGKQQAVCSKVRFFTKGACQGAPVAETVKPQVPNLKKNFLRPRWVMRHVPGWVMRGGIAAYENLVSPTAVLVMTQLAVLVIPPLALCFLLPLPSFLLPGPCPLSVRPARAFKPVQDGFEDGLSEAAAHHEVPPARPERPQRRRQVRATEVRLHGEARGDGGDDPCDEFAEERDEEEEVRAVQQRHGRRGEVESVCSDGEREEECF